MCGIVGHIGAGNSADILIEGLKRLEYRGYDSSGIALLNDNGLFVEKEVGKLQNLIGKLAHNKSGHNRYWPYKMGNTWWCYALKRASSYRL